ncbi:MAG: hypothetical protein KBS93_07465 [Flavobacteriaceae bacterium]|nr:hypothetical protein [Candidatus Onthonaster equi]
MRKILLFIFVICFSSSIFAQRHEIGIFAGGANVIGDIGSSYYINPFPTRLKQGGKIVLPISIGGLYRFNINPHMGFRVNLSYSHVGAGDFNSGEQYKIDRNKSFTNDIKEGALLFEYNFNDINEAQEFAHSPYIFFGGAIFNAKNRIYDYDQKTGKVFHESLKENKITFPFGVGYKIRFNYAWVLAFETGFRYTNQDFLDYNTAGITTELMDAGKIDPKINAQILDKNFGNKSNNDWYVQTGLSLTYSFGRPACYCN